jgi:hypothetical protein
VAAPTTLRERADQRRTRILGQLRTVQGKVARLGAAQDRELKPAIRAFDRRLRIASERTSTPEEFRDAIAGSREWRSLLRSVERSASQFGRETASMVQQAQARAALQAARDADQLLRVASGEAPRGATRAVARSISKPDAELATRVLGSVQRAAPSPSSLVQQMPVEARARMIAALDAAVSDGADARAVGRAIRDASRTTTAQGQTIARTESVRAYRAVLHEAYRQNEDLLEGWVWRSSLSSTTCAACWAMHGTRHPIDEDLDGHVNCKCIPIPLGKSWEDLAADNPQLSRYADLPDTRPEIIPGAERFAGISDAEKLRVLGPTRFKLYKAGKLKLEDAVAVSSSPAYGQSVGVANLKRTERNAQNRRKRERRSRLRS